MSSDQFKPGIKVRVIKTDCWSNGKTTKVSEEALGNVYEIYFINCSETKFGDIALKMPGLPLFKREQLEIVNE
jgi:hypothetical protein